MTKTISSRNFRSTVEMCFEFGPTWNNFLFNSLYIMGRQLIEKRLDLIFLCRIFTRGRLGDLLGLLGPKNLDKKLDFSGDFSIKNWPNAAWIWPFMINNNNNKTFLRIFFITLCDQNNKLTTQIFLKRKFFTSCPNSFLSVPLSYLSHGLWFPSGWFFATH